MAQEAKEIAPKNYVLIAFGLWLMVDGIVSILYYSNQSLSEHAVRAVRTGIGGALVLFGLLA